VIHVPVLLEESLRYLDVKPDGVYADLTLGLGGHAEAVLKLLGEGGRLAGIDKDAEALKKAGERLARHKAHLTLIKSDFRAAAASLGDNGIKALDGFIMDLGVSTLQLKTPARGFGFTVDAPLDMRMDPSRGKTAADLLSEKSEGELADIIRVNGEERWAKTIARRIVSRRETSPIRTTLELAEEVKKAIPAKFWPPRTHPATRTFQALRISVNDELAALSECLSPMVGMLKPGGRAVVISYHSLEDRIVKNTLRDLARGCVCPPDFPRCVCGREPVVRVLTPKAVIPTDAETRQNPSARSARLRAAERL
jgi:16S rRNA (cytosine1402-N4)-methyltransferase